MTGSPHHPCPPDAPDAPDPAGHDVAGISASPAWRRRVRLWQPSMWALTLLVLAVTAVHAFADGMWGLSGGRPDGDRRDAGSPTVETIGWVSFALVIVVVLGTILRAKLTAFAQSLPTSLNW